MSAAPRVCHVITALGTGGAEMMLWKLLAASERLREGATVISLRDAGTVGPRIRALGVPVEEVGIGGGPGPGHLRRLRAAVRSARPDAVQGWMYHGDLAALFGAQGTGRPVLWNIRQSLGRLADEKPGTAFVIRAGALLSRRARVIVYNSRVSAAQHERLGYAVDRTRLLPNGFDVHRFRPDPGAGERLRHRIGAPPHARIVGMIARFHPMKDHANFLAAMGRLLPADPSLHVVLAGTGVVASNEQFARLMPGEPWRARIHALGEETDVAALLAGLDVCALSSSRSEGFPNVVGEALACAVPCVVTDCGDAAEVLGEAGEVVAPEDPLAFAVAVRRLLDLTPEVLVHLGNAGRERIMRDYAIESVARRYEALYEEVAGC
jgi:glycosyltransferase involved in cell wall biosynthesis